MGGRRVQKNFADKLEAKRVARQILGELTNDAEAVEAMATPELESLVAARRVLAPSYALHVAVEEVADLSYDALGRLAQIAFSNGTLVSPLTLAYEWDDADQVTRRTWNAATGDSHSSNK